MGDASSLKTLVVMKLGLVTDDDLEAILTSLDLSVSETRRKKDKAVFNAIVRYLTSEDVEDLEDEGLSIFLKLKDSLTEMLSAIEAKSVVEEVPEKVVPEADPTKDMPEEVAESKVLSEAVATKVASAVADTKVASPVVVKKETPRETSRPDGDTRVQYYRFREFRIEGGTVGGQGSLSYATVSFQMAKGLEAGYSEREVMMGVIKAMKGLRGKDPCEENTKEEEYVWTESRTRTGDTSDQ